MTSVHAAFRKSTRVGGLGVPGALGYAVLAGVVTWWTWRAFHDPRPLDLGLAYQGGQVAWLTGHPEFLSTWISTPFLGATMALATRIVSVETAAVLWNGLNVVLVLCMLGVTLLKLRASLPPKWWWLLALALVSFGPMMSSIWWKQFNIIALALALAGFWLIRGERPISGGVLIGVSLAIKPLALFLPVVLLARYETRRAGAWALGSVVVLNVAAQGFMASRAHHLSALNVLPVLRDFAHKARPANVWACVAENFAPGSLLCRVVGGGSWTLQHLLVWSAVALLAGWVVVALRGYRTTSWEAFAFTCALSPMVSPFAWSHYQITLAPLFVLLLVRFSREGARLESWVGLGVAFVLASLIWQPYGSIIGAGEHLIFGVTQSQRWLFRIEAVAEFAQYVLIVTGLLWYARRRVPQSAPTRHRPHEAYAP